MLGHKNTQGNADHPHFCVRTNGLQTDAEGGREGEKHNSEAERDIARKGILEQSLNAATCSRMQS